MPNTAPNTAPNNLPPTARRVATRWPFWGAIGGVAVLLVVILVLGLRPARVQSQLAESINTVGHFGLFGLLALAMAMAFPTVIPSLNRRPWQVYGLSFACVFILGGMLEVLQSLTPTRSPSWRDLQYDALGAIAGLALLAIVDRPARSSRATRWRARAAAPMLLIALAVALWPLYSCGRDYLARDREFPQLHRFDQTWSKRFRWQDSSVVTLPTRLPDDWPSTAARDVIRVRIDADAPYPGIGFKEPHANWSGYGALEFDCYNFASSDLPFAVRIHDFQHAARIYEHRHDDYTDRFNRALELRPGFQTLRIPLVEVANGPRNRRLDLTNVEGLKLFAIKPSQPIELILGNFRLVK